MTIPYITPKQQEIPKLIYKFRFLNRLQIQTLLNHKYHKRIIDWLNDLVKKRIIRNSAGLIIYSVLSKLSRSTLPNLFNASPKSKIAIDVLE